MTASSGRDAVEAGVALEDVGHREAAVGLLVVLEEVDERAADRAARAVQRVHELRALVALDACAEAPGRVVGVVRARRRFAVATLRRQPYLDVELLRGRG